jgi:DNA-directed RNA polymerase subunit RPC12/RpoP
MNMNNAYDAQGLTGEWSHPSDAPNKLLLALEAKIKEQDVIIQALEAAAAATCTWTLIDDPDGEYWTALCGLAWYFEDGGIIDNGMIYCPKCGRRIVVMVEQVELGEDEIDKEMDE